MLFRFPVSLALSACHLFISSIEVFKRFAAQFVPIVMVRAWPLKKDQTSPLQTKKAGEPHSRLPAGTHDLSAAVAPAAYRRQHANEADGNANHAFAPLTALILLFRRRHVWH